MLAPACRELCFPPIRGIRAIDRKLIEQRKHLRGKKLAAVRRLLDLRARNRNKGLPRGRFGLKGGSRRLTANDLMEIYQREAEKQRLLVKKSDYAQTQLLFIVEAMKDLLADDGFSTLLRAERLEKMPRALQSRMAGHVDE